MSDTGISRLKTVNDALYGFPAPDQPRSTPQNSIELVPYVIVKDIPTISDDELNLFFARMGEQDLVRMTFIEGAIRTAEDFRKLCKNLTNLVVFPAIDNRLVGMAWLNGVYDNHAFSHICMFREVWGEEARILGNVILNYWFSFSHANEPLFDVLLGAIPKFNERAIKYAMSLGYNMGCHIPKYFNNAYTGYREDCALLYITRG